MVRRFTGIGRDKVECEVRGERRRSGWSWVNKGKGQG